MNCKNKSFMTKRKAFTLIELLIVIAIIGILFIVLISKVDFATDKAKATGVQTDFRSFQVAIESVARENSGLATFGWDTGDTNGDRIRNSYDKGDTNKNGKQDAGEVFIGSKTYGETWTNVYTLTNPADANDKSAIIALEEAINKNLDPKLHITINDDLTITMANGAQDPWDTEYHGYYITNATVDNKDRGAIVIYSNGANQEFGSEHSIAGGVVTVNVPGNNVYGKDDYGMSVIYTYVNGYGEIKTTTSGFSVNQGGAQAGTDGTFIPGGNGGSGNNGGSNGGQSNPDNPDTPDNLDTPKDPALNPDDGTTPVVGDSFIYGDYEYRYGQARIGDSSDPWVTSSRVTGWGVDVIDQNKTSYGPILESINGKPITSLIGTFDNCHYLIEAPAIPDTVTDMENAFFACKQLTKPSALPRDVVNLKHAYGTCYALKTAPDFSKAKKIESLHGTFAYSGLVNLDGVVVPDTIIDMLATFQYCDSLVDIGGLILPGKDFEFNGVFSYCSSLVDVSNFILPEGLTEGSNIFSDCTSLVNAEFKIPSTMNTMWRMFTNCTSLKYAPDFSNVQYTQDNNGSGTTYSIFMNCTSLDYIPYMSDNGVWDNTAFYNCTLITDGRVHCRTGTSFANCPAVLTYYHVTGCNDRGKCRLGGGDGGATEGSAIGDTINLPAENYNATLNDYTWEEIKELAEAQMSANELYNKYGIIPGQIKTSNGIEYLLTDVNMYGGFVFMFNSNTNELFDSAKGAVYATSSIFNTLTSMYNNLETSDNDLFKVIKKANVAVAESDDGYNYSKVNMINQGFFLASIKNVTNSSYIPDNEYLNQEGELFDCVQYRQNAGSISQILNDSYWLRTTLYNGEYNTGVYASSGSLGYSVSNSWLNSQIVAPCFVVG